MAPTASAASSSVKTPSFAIIGGGFSGVATLRALVSKAKHPLELHLFEHPSALAKGLAYHTPHPAHLLNVPAAKMGAYPDNPGHFWEWLSMADAPWRKTMPAIAAEAAHWNTSSFVPRVLFGIYLREIYDQTLAEAKQRGHSLHIHPAYVNTLNPAPQGLELTLSNEQRITVDRAILATGHPESRQLGGSGADNPGQAYLADLWGDQAEYYWRWFAGQTWNAKSHAVILGTGLSAIDMLYSLVHSNFPGHITMLSRNGVLPRTHQDAPQALTPAALDAIAPTAQGIRDYVAARAAAENADPRDVVDSLRPVTNALWQRLPLEEQQRFIREHFGWWNVIRHRMPQASAALIERLQQSGQLTLRAGYLESVAKADKDKLQLRLRSPNPEQQESDVLNADTVLNALGYIYDLTKTTHPLLVHLRDQEMLLPNPLGMGLLTDGAHGVKGKAEGLLYAVGPLLYGERLESTAVPDVRQHAIACAEVLLG